MFQLLFKVGYLCIYEPSFTGGGMGIIGVDDGVDTGACSCGVGSTSSDVLGSSCRRYKG